MTMYGSNGTTNDGNGNPCEPATRCPSHILRFLESKLGASAIAEIQVTAMKSAQQQMLVLSNILPPPQIETYQLSDIWREALQLGRNKLVVRIWKASSCWWGLHRNDQSCEASGVVALARSEVAGYRIAKQALAKLHTPTVLYFSHDNHATQNSLATEPWAMFANVGYDSEVFHAQKPDHSWMQQMITTRMEFGFEEPHPRWGRLPVELCVDYALSILRTVTIPLHQYMHSENDQSIRDELKALRGACTTDGTNDVQGITHQDMVTLYADALAQMRQTLTTTNTYLELGNGQETQKSDSRLEAAVDILSKAIDQLKQQSPTIAQLPPVLCHMDCQPQNMLFAQSKETSRTVLPQISSVLDWEEAAYADPRFELLLLCRKVCANRDQAEHVWKTYQQEYTSVQGGIILGPIQPWMELETVHSITTLVLQSMDLLGGGRSPWESKPDLWGKIEREIQRLVHQYGWSFCDIPEFRE